MELRVSGEAFGDPDVLTLWLSVEADGTVVTGEGVPEWWGEDAAASVDSARGSNLAVA